MTKINEINALIKENADAGTISPKDVSDRHHTFRQLYDHRTMLFCTLCNCFPKYSWKSKKHFDNENDPMFDGDFIAGINTPEGQVTYHIKLKYWDLFQIPEIEHAPKYDNYTNEDVLQRILSIKDLK